MQLCSLAVYTGNQPSLFGVLRHANTSTGQTARQKPHALHMSSPTTTSHLPAGPREGFLSGLNSGILTSGGVRGSHDLPHDILGAGDVRARAPLGGLRVARGDGVEDLAVLAIGVLEPALGLQQQRME